MILQIRMITRKKLPLAGQCIAQPVILYIFMLTLSIGNRQVYDQQRLQVVD